MKSKTTKLGTIFGTLIILAVLGATAAMVFGAGGALTRDELSTLRFLQANYSAGILREFPSLRHSGTPSLQSLSPKAGNPCTLTARGHLSPQARLPMWHLLSCLKQIPHNWWIWTNSSSICSGDVVVALWQTNALGIASDWPAITFTGSGQFTNGWPWGPLMAVATMKARNRFILATPFEYCPEDPSDSPLVRCAVRCSPNAPLYNPTNQPGGPPPLTNHISPVYSGGQFQLGLTNWAPGRTVELFENPSLANPYWIHVATVTIGPNGTATTNINPVFPCAFYIGRGL